MKRESTNPYILFIKEGSEEPFYMALSTPATSFSAFLSEEDLERLQGFIDAAKRERYEYLVGE